MTSIPLTNTKIQQLLEPFLNKEATPSTKDELLDEAVIALDDVLFDFGCKYRLIVQKRPGEGRDCAIVMHIGVIEWDVVQESALNKLQGIFGEKNVFTTSTQNIDIDTTVTGTGTVASNKEDSDSNPHPMDSVAHGYNVCIRVCSNALPSEHDAKSMITSLSEIRIVILGSRLQDAFHDLTTKQDHANNPDLISTPTTFTIPIQRTTAQKHQSIIVSCQNDRVTAVIPFSYRAEHETDCALARLFLQQFNQAQRKSMNERHGKNVPICDWRSEPPREVTLYHDDDTNANVDVNATAASNDTHHAGYLSLTFLEHHIDTDVKLSNCVKNALMVVDFVDYHVKCSKSNMNSRMRSKKDALMKKLFDE